MTCVKIISVENYIVQPLQTTNIFISSSQNICIGTNLFICCQDTQGLFKGYLKVLSIDHTNCYPKILVKNIDNKIIYLSQCSYLTFTGPEGDIGPTGPTGPSQKGLTYFEDELLVGQGSCVGTQENHILKVFGGSTLPKNFVVGTEGFGSFWRDDISQPIKGNTRGTGSNDLSISRNQCTQVASGSYSLIGGGESNTCSGSRSVIGSGILNTCTGSQSSIISGSNNLNFGDFSWIGSGNSNQITKSYSIIGGGTNNKNELSYSSIFNGSNNNIIGLTGSHNVIGCGITNKIENSFYSFLGNGNQNQLSNSSFGFIGCGTNNRLVNADYGFIGCGSNNLNESLYSSIVGGRSQFISSNSSFGFIGGGDQNQINSFTGTNQYSFIGGGSFNQISPTGSTLDSSYSFIGGGFKNIISSNHAVILGGTNHLNSSSFGTIGGGSNHQMLNSIGSFIGGGSNHLIQNSKNSVIGGGSNHLISTDNGFIGGGVNNQIKDTSIVSVIGGGLNNQIRSIGNYSVIGGGINNIIEEEYCSIPGGSNLLLQTKFSSAVGRNNLPGSVSGLSGVGFTGTSSTLGNITLPAQQRIFMVGNGNVTRTNAFSVTENGFALAQFGFVAGQADFAEWFKSEEHIDPFLPVYLDQGKVKLITLEMLENNLVETNKIIGITSLNPLLVGNNISDFEKDILGRKIYQNNDCFCSENITNYIGQSDEYEIILNNGKKILSNQINHLNNIISINSAFGKKYSIYTFISPNGTEEKFIDNIDYSIVQTNQKPRSEDGYSLVGLCGQLILDSIYRSHYDKFPSHWLLIKQNHILIHIDGNTGVITQQIKIQDIIQNVVIGKHPEPMEKTISYDLFLIR